VVIALRPYDEFLTKLQAEGRVTVAEMQALGEASSADLEQLSDARLEPPPIKL
jgi:hypothetical protein